MAATWPQRQLMDDWNAKHGKTEVPVRYWRLDRQGPGEAGMTRPFGSVLMGDSAVVYVYGAGAIALTHVEERA